MPVIPTKGNLLNIKKSLNLAQLGYSLLDRKRNILIREMMGLIDDAKAIRGEIEDTDVYKRQEQKHAVEAIAQIDADKDKALAVLQKVYEQNHQVWEDDLYNRVLGR